MNLFEIYRELLQNLPFSWDRKDEKAPVRLKIFANEGYVLVNNKQLVDFIGTCIVEHQRRAERLAELRDALEEELERIAQVPEGGEVT